MLVALVVVVAVLILIGTVLYNRNETFDYIKCSLEDQLDQIVYEITTQGETIVSANQDTVDALTAQVNKSRDEVVGALDALKAEVEALKGQVAEGTVDFTGLDEAVQGIDDVVPDVVEPPVIVDEPAPPVDETPVDETPVDEVPTEAPDSVPVGATTPGEDADVTL